MKALNEIEWGEFYLNTIFPKGIQRGKRLKTDNHVAGSVPYVSSTALNNGVDNFIGNKEKVRIFSNCLTLANSGSVGVTFYQPFPFVASDHVTKLENKNYSKYVYMFIAALLSRLSEKYSFNREINDRRIQKEKILLPITEDGNPDYAYMEAYMREKERVLLERYRKHLLQLADNQYVKRGG